MAELVDATDLKSVIHVGVRVRAPFQLLLSHKGDLMSFKQPHRKFRRRRKLGSTRRKNRRAARKKK